MPDKIQGYNDEINIIWHYSRKILSSETENV